MDEVGRLHRFLEGAWRLRRNLPAGRGDGLQLGYPFRGRGGQRRLSLGLIGKAMGEVDGCLQRYDRSFQEGALLKFVGLVGRQVGQGCFGLCDDTLQPHAEHLLYIHDDMTIAGSNHATAGDNARFLGSSHIRGHNGHHPVVEGLSAPGGYDGVDNVRFYLWADLKDVGAAIREVIDLIGQEVN